MSLNLPAAKRGPVCNGWWNSRDKALMHGHAACPVHDRPEAPVTFGALPTQPNPRRRNVRTNN